MEEAVQTIEPIADMRHVAVEVEVRAHDSPSSTGCVQEPEMAHEAEENRKKWSVKKGKQMVVRCGR